MRVLQTKSPELFDGSEDEPVKVTDYDYMPFCQAVCETCGDDPEMLTIIYETKKENNTGRPTTISACPICWKRWTNGTKNITDI